MENMRYEPDCHAGPPSITLCEGGDKPSFSHKAFAFAASSKQCGLGDRSALRAKRLIPLPLLCP
jgi:hypothetical protein